jgi:integrase
MPAQRIKTRTPGIFKRGGRYVFSYKLDGTQHWESCRTLDEARRLKAARTADIARGEFEARSRLTLHQYAGEWVERYQGKGRRGFRENTRARYRLMLSNYALTYFSERVRLTDLSPSKIAAFIGWCCERTTNGKPISDATVLAAMAPLRSCLATAVREGLIRSNPARDIDLPNRTTEREQQDVRSMSPDELAMVLKLIPERWRLFFTFLASTGLRISEAIALQWEHLQLDGSSPHVKVRRALVQGRMEPPKSRYSRRDVPLSYAVAEALKQRRKGSEWPGEHDLVFTAGNGSALSPKNLRRRVLKPAAEEANLSWIGFHAFRHTCASMLFAEGRNAVQVQHWLGHHSAAFTLATYVHLLDGDIGQPLELPVTTSVTTPPSAPGQRDDESAHLQAVL